MRCLVSGICRATCGRARCLPALLLAAALLGLAPARAAPFFYLVRQWPFSACPEGSDNCVYKPNREAFTLHGLWINYDTGKWPQFCRHDTFDASKITAVRPLMNALWPSYYGPDEEFWAHEWEKHGTCAEDVFPSQLAYFNTTLNMHLSHSLEAALAAGGVEPSNSARYRSEDMVDAIKAGIGSQPLVHCERGKVTEIWMCVDENLRFEDCDAACPNPGCHNEECAGPMLYPAAHSGCGDLWSCAAEAAAKLLAGYRGLATSRAGLRGFQQTARA